MNRKVKKISPSLCILPKLKRVAAYTRVSSGKEAMLHSLSAQVSYYSKLIQNNPEWRYPGVYADEAMTGTKYYRPEFQKLIADCKAGKIDMIITKSISRFARNTVTMLETVRELKNIGTNVYFQKENIHSMSGDGELMLTILASFAQEESLSVSENCKWRIRNKFKEGLPSNFLIFGYEFKIVRMIFSDFLGGMGRNAIMKKLIELKIPTKRDSRFKLDQSKNAGVVSLNCTNDVRDLPTGAPRWRESVIYKMLRNEKYVEDLLLQKSFSSDHINKKKCDNRGEMPMYYVKNSHKAIIDRETFNKVQIEIDRRAKLRKQPKSTGKIYPFTGKIICDQCGKNYRRKIAASGTKYEKPVWICSTFNNMGKKFCPSQQIPENILESLVPSDFEQIRVPGPNRIIIISKDGTSIEKTWRHPSRRESWTDEMKINAKKRSVAKCSKQEQ